MRLLLILILCLAVLLAACGDDDADSDPTTPPSETPAGTETPSPSPTLPPLLTPGPVQATGAQSLESTVITFQISENNSVGLNAEIADDPEERHIGLMFRESLGEDFGMLFIWPEDTNTGFWMQNTYVPLSVAFVKADGTVIALDDMEPETTELHTAPEAYRYAIEANHGWFEENGVEVGETVDLGSAQPR